MKFEIKHRWSGAVLLTADIDCADDAETSVKLGLAVKWAVKNKANLIGANLNRANLDEANLIGANLDGANLDGANLNRANLNRANLDGANLNGANLDGANLDGANLNGANLDGANLIGANLNRANLNRASLNRASGNSKNIKSMQIETYAVAYTAEVLQIGCERHSLDEWRDFDDDRIIKMDGKVALTFWRKWKDWIFQTVEMSPAEPTKPVEVAPEEAA